MQSQVSLDQFFFQDLEDSIVKICTLMQKKSENIIMKCHSRKLQF